MPKPIPRYEKRAESRALGLVRGGRFLAPAILTILAVLALVMVTRPASPQLDSSQPPPQTPGAAQPVAVPQPDPPGTVDGAKNPGLIPDEVAYRVVLEAIAEPQNPTDEQRARFQAKIAAAHLPEHDRDALFVVLGELQTQLDSLNTQAEQIRANTLLLAPDSVGYQQLLNLSKQREQAFSNALGAIPARLTAPGVMRLRDFVRGEKRGMKYLPDKPMSKP